MEINQQKTVKVNAKTLRIHCKASVRPGDVKGQGHHISVTSWH